MSDHVAITRFDEGDSGTEIRVEVHLGGNVIEMVCTDGIFGKEVDVVLLGPDPDAPYRFSRSLGKTRLQ